MCSSPWDSKESYMTEPLNGTELIITYKNFLSILLFLSAVFFNCLVITWSSLDTKLIFFFFVILS